MNPELSPEQRAADLVSRMTLEEKALLTSDRNAASIWEAETLAKDSYVAIVFVGLNSELEQEETSAVKFAGSGLAKKLALSTRSPRREEIDKEDIYCPPRSYCRPEGDIQ